MKKGQSEEEGGGDSAIALRFLARPGGLPLGHGPAPGGCIGALNGHSGNGKASFSPSTVLNVLEARGILNALCCCTWRDSPH